jgi:hypothetical protein
MLAPRPIVLKAAPSHEPVRQPPGALLASLLGSPDILAPACVGYFTAVCFLLEEPTYVL